MARVEIVKCDGCGTKMDPEREDRIVRLTAWGVLRTSRDIDLCKDCYRKAFAAIGLDVDKMPD